ncbi:MAG: glycosyltransferase [Planctomycetaceae bacterium]|nr:glycosyltransferase [Planctomycetaceae bacterium]
MAEHSQQSDAVSGQRPAVAVLIPACNEEASIGAVVDAFRRELPAATIFVFDNCSTDATAAIAAARGAIVRNEPRQGKGYVIERMFDTVEADAYVMVDGDDTYPAEKVHDLLAPILAGQADMVVGARLEEYSDKAFRPLHVCGNKLVRALVNWAGHSRLSDIMSGYRAFSRRVIERLPVVSAGFEVETDMTIQMLYYRMMIVEVPVHYRPRGDGSASKLRTVRDGVRVMWKIFTLFRSFKPLTFFGAAAAVLFLCGLLAGATPIHDYATTSKVTHQGLAIMAVGLMVLSSGSLFLGIMLHAINWRLRELHNVMCRIATGSTTRRPLA